MDTVMLGTPHYMAPEQAMGTVLDHRVDIYSIGIIAFEVLCGEVPFTGDNPVAVAYKHVTDRIPETLEYFPEMRPRLKAAVYKALAKNPEVRFATAAQFESELAAVQLEYSSGAIRIPPGLQGGPQPQEKGKSPPTGFPRLEVPAIPLRPLQRRAPETKSPRVLLVDADGERRRSRRSELVEAGYMVLEASDGFDALEMLPRVQPGLLVIDTRLPGMDGFDVTRAIRSSEDLSKLPVILLVPALDRHKYAFGIQCGANDLLDASGSEDDLSVAARRQLEPDEDEMPSYSCQ
jgi:CheY-like chemotaxis protein